MQIFSVYVKRGGACQLDVLTGGPQIRLIERMLQPGALTDGQIFGECDRLARDELALQVSRPSQNHCLWAALG